MLTFDGTYLGLEFKDCDYNDEASNHCRWLDEKLSSCKNVENLKWNFFRVVRGVWSPSNNEWFATILEGHGGSGFGTKTYQFTIPPHDRGIPWDGIQKELIICSIEQDPEIFYCDH
jgi:hypothetical protein